MNIIYMGTPDFAVPTLKTLINSKHNVIAVYTKEDKPKGRGYAVAQSPIKEVAIENNIPVYQPKTLKSEEEFNKIKELNADIIIVAAYGLILPKSILEQPKYGCVNLHGSILPKYRGAAPIQWAVLNGENVTGVTLMQMDIGLDTGDMLYKKEIQISENDKACDVHDKLSLLSSEMILESLEKIENNEFIPEKQDDSLSNYAKMLDKSLCNIDWNKSSQEVHNLVRGLNSWPIAVSQINGKRVKIYSTKKSDLQGKPSEIISVNPLVVACASGSVEIEELQLEGKKRMKASDFTRGNKLEKGQYFI